MKKTCTVFGATDTALHLSTDEILHRMFVTQRIRRKAYAPEHPHPPVPGSVTALRSVQTARKDLVYLRRTFSCVAVSTRQRLTHVIVRRRENLIADILQRKNRPLASSPSHRRAHLCEEATRARAHLDVEAGRTVDHPHNNAKLVSVGQLAASKLLLADHPSGPSLHSANTLTPGLGFLWTRDEQIKIQLRKDGKIAIQRTRLSSGKSATFQLDGLCGLRDCMGCQ